MVKIRNGSKCINNFNTRAYTLANHEYYYSSNTNQVREKQLKSVEKSKLNLKDYKQDNQEELGDALSIQPFEYQPKSLNTQENKKVQEKEDLKESNLEPNNINKNEEANENTKINKNLSPDANQQLEDSNKNENNWNCEENGVNSSFDKMSDLSIINPFDEKPENEVENNMEDAKEPENMMNHSWDDILKNEHEIPENLDIEFETKFDIISENGSNNLLDDISILEKESEDSQSFDLCDDKSDKFELLSI